MPLMLELKYEHFIGTWPGRIKCVELVSKHFSLYRWFCLDTFIQNQNPGI